MQKNRCFKQQWFETRARDGKTQDGKNIAKMFVPAAANFDRIGIKRVRGEEDPEWERLWKIQGDI